MTQLNQKIIFGIKRSKRAVVCIIPSFLLEYPIVKKIIGFSFVGIFVTIVGMTLTFILLKIIGISPYLTYFISYFTTILLSYYLNSRLVFKSGKSARNLVLYYVVYGISMLIGLATLYIYRLLLNWDDLLLNYMVIPITMAWNFLVSSKILKPQNCE
ncbi:MAG: GtrA family protein [Bacteroidales bacterium]|jgi:putative flippase GtrA|nr:GtrA family protein [Bacteroidales bacterium]